MRHPHHVLICLAVVIAAGAWGLYWLPQRALQEAGMTGGWATIAQYVVPLILLAPLALWRARRGQATGFGLPLIGLLMGGGFALYANSLLLTEVVRTLLLFYLAPVWATILEALFLRQRPGWSRAVSLALALAGVWIVFGRAGETPFPHNAGDWLALLAGVLFAGGAARAEAVQPHGIFPLLFAFFLYGGLVAVGQSVLLAGELGPMPSAQAWRAMLPWLALLSVCFIIPAVGVLLWSPSRIGVGLYSILILAELVFGVVSAALLADERFGWREALGSAAIVLAGVLEVAFAKGVPRELALRTEQRGG